MYLLIHDGMKITAWYHSHHSLSQKFPTKITETFFYEEALFVGYMKYICSLISVKPINILQTSLNEI